MYEYVFAHALIRRGVVSLVGSVQLDSEPLGVESSRGQVNSGQFVAKFEISDEFGSTMVYGKVKNKGDKEEQIVVSPRVIT